MYKRIISYLGVFLLFSTSVMGQVRICSSNVQNAISNDKQYKKKEQIYLDFCDEISGKFNTLDEIFKGDGSKSDWKKTWGGGKTGSAINITNKAIGNFKGINDGVTTP